MNAGQQTSALDRPSLQWGLLVAAAAALLGLAVAAALWPREGLAAWLIAATYWLAVALGCLVMLMVQHLTGGMWGLLLRRILEAASQTFVLLALAMVPVLVGLAYLYPWAAADTADPSGASLHPPLDEAKAAYFSRPAFFGRAAVYFVLWWWFAWRLWRASGEEDQTADPHFADRAARLSAPGLVVLGLTITFAAIDWLMSLEPNWYSSIFGVLFATASVLAGFAWAIVALVLLGPLGPLQPRITTEELRAIGSLLLALVLLWTYMAFSQWLLIWAANLPEEVVWYLHRMAGGWQWIGLVLGLLQFALPFFLLLTPVVRGDPRRLAAVASLVLVLRWLDHYWLIAPSIDGNPALILWLSFLGIIGLGGLWLAVVLRALRRRPMLPPYDDRLLGAPGHA